MGRRFRICSIALLWILASVARLTAQTPLPLYANLTPDPSGSPPLGIRTVSFIWGLDLAGLRGAPEMLEIVLPAESFTATLIEFERFAGFDQNGAPIPGEEQVLLWSGQGAGNDVILSLAGEFLTGVIDGPSGQFAIRKFQQSDALLSLAPEELPPDEEPDPVPVLSGFARRGRESPAVERVDTLPRKVGVGGVAPPVLRIAVLFTEAAKMEIINDPDYALEFTPLWSFSNAAMGSANTAFRNSGIDTRVRLAGFAEIDFLLEDLEVQPGENSSLIFRDVLRNDPMVKAIRDQLEADVVAVVLRSSASSIVNGCGFAHTQRPGCGDYGPIPGCSMGRDFSEFSLFWVAQNCALGGRHAFAHELGHAMGLEHSEETGVPRDRASFFFAFGNSFGATDPEGPHRTVMGQGVGTRRLIFSGPDVFYNGFPTGAAGFSDNAQVIRLLTPVMEGFRGFSSYIFLDGFERGDTLFWIVDGTAAARGDPP